MSARKNPPSGGGGGGGQPLDSDLTAIAALTTTAFGRSLLTLADAAALLSTAGAQPLDSDLTAIAALTTTAFGRSLLALANGAALLSAAGAAAAVHAHAEADVTNLVTDLAAKQPLDSDLTAIAALSTTAFGRSFLALADAAAARTLAGLVIGTDVAAQTHATQHKSGGGDSIKLDELAAPTDVTTLNASTAAHGLLRKLDNNAAHFLDGTGAWSTPAGGGGGPTLAMKTADETVAASTVLQNDDHLLFAIGASATEVWCVELFLAFAGANVSMDAKAGWSVPAGCTMLWGSLPGTGENAQPGFGATQASQTPTALLTESGALAVGSGNLLFGVAITALVFGGGSAGNVVLQWAQNTSDAGNLTAKKGSFLRATKLAA